MTLIECFDPVPAENIISCLRLRPEKLIFLGSEGARISADRYRRVLKERGMNTQVIVRSVPRNDPKQVVRVLSDIIRQEAQCVIDVTGGDEAILMSVGALYTGLEEALKKKVTIQRFDMETETAGDCDGDGAVIQGVDADLSARELIYLHGGMVHPRIQQPDTRYTPADLQPLWDLARSDPKAWNLNVSILREFESRSQCSPQILLSLEALRGIIGQFDSKWTCCRDFLDSLKERGVIDDQSTADTVYYTYRNSLLSECLEKAGNILEIKTLLEARSLLSGGKPYFHDCQMSVHIDWDGNIRNGLPRTPETRNEIDLILMHGMTPLFVSCKNGNIPDEELYKLNTVADRFGSRYAKKLLIATHLDRKNDFSDETFIRRAKDMGIYLIPDAAKLSPGQWKYHLRRAAEF